MIKKSALIYFPPWKYDSLFNRSQPLAMALSSHLDVFYIDPLEYSLLSGKGKLGRKFPWLNQFSNLVVNEISPQLNVVKISSLFGNRGVPGFNRFSNRAELKLNVFFKEKRKQYEKLFLLSNRPMLGFWDKKEYFDKTILDLEDPWFDLAWGSNENIQRIFHSAANQVDLIIANGPEIADAYSTIFNKEIFSLSNGISPFFIEESGERVAPPEIFTSNNENFQFFYAGNINDRIDFAQLFDISKNLKDIHFIFAGNDNVPPGKKDEWEKYLSLPNVSFIGAIPHREIKNYYNNSHALLLPYHFMGSSLMFPAKIVEYLSAKKYILSTFQLNDMDDIVCFYKTEADFMNYVEKMKMNGFKLTNESAKKADLFCRKNTWSKKAETLLSVIGDN